MREADKEFADYFYLTPPSFKNISGIWPLRAGRNIAKENYHIGPRFIDSYSFHFVLEGEIAYKYDDKTILLQKGGMFCLHPDIAYEYYTLSHHLQLKMGWIAFSKAQMTEIISSLKLTKQQSSLQIVDYQHVHQTLTSVFRVLETFDDTEMVQVLQLQQLVYQLIYLLLDHTQQPNHARSTWLERGKAYIDQHYTERITIQDTANYVGVNRSYFSEQFSTIYGIAPIKYLQKLRLEGKRCYAPPLTVSQKSPYH
ncbi:AraC family ligand binding domain-containing protein [Gracilibacillus alcaliphilus]|uniref:AraC family ligand binding domain-containing protein n=1 Tax=Gracilibacillus alcaliphilus TaxID=1401441 RepID=UPI001959EA24|nr:hypothetical protein [Gracilibacillus alcaliphilus]